MGLNLTDIVALAKQGYKPADIKELIALSTDSESNQQDDAGQNQGEGQTPEGTGEPEKPTEETEPNHKPEQELDYKKMYEESQKALAEAQKKNVNQNAGGTEEASDQELLDSLMQSFM